MEIGKILAGVAANVDETEDKEEQIESFCDALDMTEKELKKCEHEVDITKTCRSIVKHLYPDVNDRGKMLISTMDVAILHAIQGKNVVVFSFDILLFSS